MVITGTDFRTNQSHYIGAAYRGEDVVVKARAGSFRVVPVWEDVMPIRSRDIKAELQGAFRQVKEHIDGKGQLTTAEELLDELRRINN